MNQRDSATSCQQHRRKTANKRKYTLMKSYFTVELPLSPIVLLAFISVH